MAYSITELARLADVSSRTLRYYEQIGLLKPERQNGNGYRVYGTEEVDRLRQILLYRELDMELSQIKHLLDDEQCSIEEALLGHVQALSERRERLDNIIAGVNRAIQAHRKGIKMSDKEKFQGFKKKLVDENEKRYGTESREKYGDKTIDDSNGKLMNLTEEEYARMAESADELQKLLETAVQNGESFDGVSGKKAAELHKNWLSYSWTNYSAEAHKGLAQMYVDDERFTKHYDKDVVGCAKFLRDAIHHHI